MQFKMTMIVTEDYLPHPIDLEIITICHFYNLLINYNYNFSIKNNNVKKIFLKMI